MEVMKDCIRQILLGLQYLVLQLITLILSELEENEQMIFCYMKLVVLFLLQEQNSILHRDIKGANILVDEQDGNLIFKIADFGHSKSAYDGVPKTFLGKKPYSRLSCSYYQLIILTFLFCYYFIIISSSIFIS